MEKLLILIIEDDYYASRRLERKIYEIGHSVVGIATNVNEAIVAFNNYSFDLVIMDIELKDNPEGGIELAKILRKTNPIPVIFYTGKLDSKNIRKAAAQTTPSAILSKTFNANELEVNIDKAFFELKKEKNEQETDIEKIKQLTDMLQKTYSLVVDLYKVVSSPIGALSRKKKSFWITPKGAFPKRIIYEDICWIYTFNKGIKIFTEKSEIFYGVTLSAFERKIDAENFKKVHKTSLVNIDKVVEIKTNSKVIVVRRETDGICEEIPYSEKYLNDLKKSENFIKTRD